MRGITGIGAVKLERFGQDFLAVIRGAAAEPVHPARRRIAGQDAGALFDRLEAAQAEFSRGTDGLAKPLACNAATLRKIAETRPASLEALARISGVGEVKADRFGAAFLAVLRDAETG
jgi:ATP-dependent DNA helicase RecQ